MDEQREWEQEGEAGDAAAGEEDEAAAACGMMGQRASSEAPGATARFFARA